ncbi:MAG: tetratricopeptide repeat protein [Deltaproteobacteria bacterium]|nr:tetratricopeptide repeat protein [Deltaproteobacteria bacterium]
MREAEERTTPRDDAKPPVERELAELRKEVLESRNLVIKTDNLLKNLFAELKSVSKKSEDQYRRTWFASGTAYLVFLGLAVAVAVLGARASVSSERARVETAQGEAEQAKKRGDDLAAQLAKSKQDGEVARVAGERAIAVYKLLTEGENEAARLRGVDELAKLDRTRLGALELKALDDKAKGLRAELGQTAFERGRAAHRREDWRTAAAELKRYLALDPDGSESAQASYLAGTALYTLKDWASAAPYLERFVARGKGQRGADYAYFLLGQAYEAMNQPDKAGDAYRRGTTEYPASEFVPAMQQRYRSTQRAVQATQAGSGGAGAAPAPGSGAPAGAAASAPAPLPGAATSAPPSAATAGTSTPAARAGVPGGTAVHGAPAPAAQPAPAPR